ncbi:unnamed protein product [Pleuronectes platessa]|uniref:Uncharacterized protein n=1 Tax=Pleuronectes platessa TaxID=8262 RepID=A0A9N7UAE4_PLEPL|nr:unnamed protein product [Pleuronectes platessa]
MVQEELTLPQGKRTLLGTFPLEVSQACPTSRPKVDPELPGGTTYPIWPGNPWDPQEELESVTGEFVAALAYCCQLSTSLSLRSSDYSKCRDSREERQTRRPASNQETEPSEEEKIMQTEVWRQDVHVVLPLAQNREFWSNEWEGKGHA